MKQRERLLELLPHRPPMLLLDDVLSVGDRLSESKILIDDASAFFVCGKGVPSWIAVEYMGQTAALIAGYQLEKGIVGPHVGFLLGTRKFEVTTPWFPHASQLKVICQELAVVGDSLATFDCRVEDLVTASVLAKAKLSVFRKPLDQ